MPKKLNKRSHKGKTNKKNRTKKQKPILMIGCSKKNKSCKKNIFSSLGNKSCPNCGPNCHCGPNCKCPKPCPGNCYLNRTHKSIKSKGKQNGGVVDGCGSCRCPIPPLSYEAMNQFGGAYPPNEIPEVNGSPVIISPPNDKNFQPIIGIGQSGGTCSSGMCSQIPVNPQSGGTYIPPGVTPGPFVGGPYSPTKLPGENGIGGDRNYYPLNNQVNNPQLQMSMNDAGYKNMYSKVGGYRYSKDTSISSNSSKHKKGGGIIPEDLVNLGRDFSFNLKSAYNALNGYSAPVDPAPYKGQLTGSLNNIKFLSS